MNFENLLKSELNACPLAVKWAGDKTPEQAYASCERGDWMLWLASKLSIDRKLVALAACECAEQALIYVPSNELRPKRAIETARKWCRGEATLEELQAAADDAHAASAALAADVAAYHAAWSAQFIGFTSVLNTADIVAALAADAAASVDAASHTTSAAYEAAYKAARDVALKKSADIVRKHISLDVFVSAIKEKSSR